MLDEIGGGVDNPRDKHLVIRNFRSTVAEHGPFMGMARIRCLEQQIAGAGFHQRAEALVHVDVADVWSLVIAPADVNPHAGRIDVAKGVVE